MSSMIMIVRGIIFFLFDWKRFFFLMKNLWKIGKMFFMVIFFVWYRERNCWNYDFIFVVWVVIGLFVGKLSFRFLIIFINLFYSFFNFLWCLKFGRSIWKLMFWMIRSFFGLVRFLCLSFFVFGFIFYLKEIFVCLRKCL